MVRKPKRPCNHPGCRRLVEKGYCDEHRRQRSQEYDRWRGSSAERGYGHRWRKYREWFLKQNPLCVECRKRGKLTPATEVDHIRPHKGDPVLFWDAENNWQGLCKSCHSRKTAKEDGGFGNLGRH